MAKPIPHKKFKTWKRLIAKWQASSQPIAAFCRANSLKENQFHYWRPLVAAQVAAPARAFVPVRVVASRLIAVSSAEFVLSSRLVLRLAGDVSPASLVELAKALQAAGC